MYHSISSRGGQSWPWAVTLREFRSHLTLLQETGFETVLIRDLAERPAALGPRSVAITFDDGYQDNWEASEALLARGMTATWFLVTGSIGGERGWRDPGNPARKMLGLEQVRELDRAGMEIASHSRSHRCLTDLGAEEAWQEISQSRRELEQAIGSDVVSFAYPYGCYDTRLNRLVAEAGYRAACVTRSGSALAGGDVFSIRRISVLAGDGVGRFARKLALASNVGTWGALSRYGLARVWARFRQTGQDE